MILEGKTGYLLKNNAKILSEKIENFKNDKD